MMVQHDGSKGLWIADAKWNSLVNLDATGKALGTIPIRNPVVQVRHGEKGMDVLSIGRFFPTEQRLGSLLRLERQGEHFRNPEILIDGLHRPVHASWGDLNEDGREDVVISQFGWYGGRFSWFEKKGEDGYEEHLLFDKPGSLKSVILDWNDDGHPDILSLVAQETEAMLLFVNNGKGEFSETRLFQRHSGFGHTHFELLDWDRDGDQDLLVTNGDLGDYASAHRPYHGIRIYRNDGSAGFEEAWFHPMPGAYKALARDFDQDGDLDIAAISYFPDFSKGNDGGFLFLQNQGGNTYEASTFGRASDGRWLTMDVGDIDRDGDEDIVLGAANKAPGNVPKAQVDHWKKTRTSVMILKNGLR